MSSRIIRRLVVLVLAAATGAIGDRARAADGNVLGAVYGDGMKAYYAGRYTQAFDTFSQAIEAGSTDPRCYYFRGLTQLRLGRAPDARLDFEKGAEIEAKDFDVFYNVSAALERVQGSERLMLERYRAAGRKTALAEIEKIRLEYFARFTPQEAVAGPATVTGAPTTDDPAAAPATGMPATPGDGASPFGVQPAPAAPSTSPFGTTP